MILTSQTSNFSCLGVSMIFFLIFERHFDRYFQPFISLTGLEEALEELRRYEDDESAIEYYPNSTRDYPSTSQATAATTTTTSTASATTSSIHPVDPLSGIFDFDFPVIIAFSLFEPTSDSS